MSRYRKAVLNEYELQEIDGTKAFIKPSVEDKFEALEIVKSAQLDKDIDLKRVRSHLVNLLFKSQKEEGEDRASKDDIDSFVVPNIFELWVEYLTAIGISKKDDSDKAQEDLKN